MEEVTPNEIAKTLSVTGLTFRNWLRAEKAAGHPILAGHEYRSHYRFTRQEADQLVAEYRASRGHPRAPGQPYRSDSQTGAPMAAAVPARPAVITAGGERTQAADSASRPLPPVPASFGREDLEAAGFTGWTTWADLHACDFAVVPSKPGAYVVFRPSDGAPAFVHPSPAGWFKGEDPSVPEGRLQAEWVDGANVLYIGKADFRNRRKAVEALRERLGEYGAYGAGQPIAHRGGRLIWQLADSRELLVAWHEVTWAETARDYEKRLLARFAELYDARRPFANLTG